MRVPVLIDVWVALVLVAGCGFVAGAMVTGMIQPAVAGWVFLIALATGVLTASRFVSRLRTLVRERLNALAELARVDATGTIWRHSASMSGRWQAISPKHSGAGRIGCARSMT